MIKGDRACAENVAYPAAVDKSSSEISSVIPNKPSAEVITTTAEKSRTELVPVADQSSVQANMNIVQNYVAAFNAQNVDLMLEMLTDDVQWLTIDGETITKETNSKEELRKVMTDYFNSCSTCRSRLANTFSTGSKVSALEVVSYQTRNGLKEERSVSLYEFSNSLIKRVYYFPAEK